MGLFKRFKSMVSGFFGVTAGKMEARKPEYLIADAEARIQKSRKQAEKQLIEIQTWAEMVRLDMRAEETRLADIRSKMSMAAQSNDRTLLVELIMQEEESQALLEERRRLHENAVQEALRVRDHYKHFEAEMKSKLRELSSMKSQTQLLVMREKIVELDNEYSSPTGNGYGTASMQNDMDRLRKSINERCARVMVTEQLRSENTDAKIKQIDYQLAWNRANEKANALLTDGNGRRESTNH